MGIHVMGFVPDTRENEKMEEGPMAFQDLLSCERSWQNDNKLTKTIWNLWVVAVNSNLQNGSMSPTQGMVLYVPRKEN